jgi:membrane-associated protease RseP (regulator of RpoE activity)
MGVSIRRSLAVALAVCGFAWAGATLAPAQDFDNPDFGNQGFNALGRFIQTIADEAQPVNYWIGVECVRVDPALRAQLSLAPDVGLLVLEVAPDSPATRAGLLRNDVLLKADGNALGDVHDLAQAVVAANGKKINLELVRANKLATISIQPAERPDELGPDMTVIPPNDREALRQWLEQLKPGDGRMPTLRFFHPGMVVPPGGIAPLASLPDDMTVTITRKGKEPAKVTVKQGEKTWETTEDKLAELPPSVRPLVEGMLAPRAWPMIPQQLPPSAFGGPAIQVPPGGFGGQHGGQGLNRQMEQMNRQLEELRKRLDKLDKPQPEDSPTPRSRT